MLTISQIETSLSAIQAAVGNEWHLSTLVPSRIHLSLSHERRATIFVEGERSSFGGLPTFRGLEHREDAKDVRSGRTFGALRITATPEPHSDRAIGFIAYEIVRNLENDPDISNSDLMAKVLWVLRLLDRERGVLSAEQQRGLVAECLLLRRLLQLGRAHSIRAQAVLDRWWGPVGGKRDFAARGIAVEVKSTARNRRAHHISSIDQLEPLADGERAFLYSAGIKSEASSDRRLPVYVSDVLSELIAPDGRRDTQAAYAFHQKLAAVGYHAGLEGLYESEPGLLPNPALEPRLFDVETLDRLKLSSFKGNQLPSMVTAVSYDLDISTPPLGAPETESVLLDLLQSPTV